MTICLCCNQDAKITRPVAMPIKLGGVLCAACELHGNVQVQVAVSCACPRKPKDAIIPPPQDVPQKTAPEKGG